MGSGRFMVTLTYCVDAHSKDDAIERVAAMALDEASEIDVEEDEDVE